MSAHFNAYSPVRQVFNRQASDDSLEYLRRAPKKGERPQYLQDIHEVAATECSRKLFSFEDSNSDHSSTTHSSRSGEHVFQAVRPFDLQYAP